MSNALVNFHRLLREAHRRRLTISLIPMDGENDGRLAKGRWKLILHRSKIVKHRGSWSSEKGSFSEVIDAGFKRIIELDVADAQRER